ncbi:MAG: amidohydrolase family protein [Crocinitomicaceae bacterium]|nr:amidohydrolase family protein [Crocinitomicaceae bacterium]
MAKNLKFTAEEQAFIDDALQQIELCAKKRINDPAKNILDKNNFVFDAHSHVFDGKCVDADYMVIRMLNLEDNPLAKKLVRFIVRRIIREQIGDENTCQNANQLLDLIYAKRAAKHSLFHEIDLRVFEKDDADDSDDKEEKGLPTVDWIGLKKRIKEVFKILNSGKMESVYQYFQKHAIHHHFRGKDLISIQLGMDLESGWQGSISKTYHDQNKELLELSKHHPVLPFFPVHPDRVRKKNAAHKHNELYDAFIEAFKKGSPTFFGIKIYPSLGYLPADMALAPILEVCERANIPVTAHCGGEIISTFEDKIHTSEFRTPIVIHEENRKANARKLNDPINWIPVLEEFPKLRLNLGHFGSDWAWEKSENELHVRIQTILDLMQKYKNVYADFSFNLNNKKSSENFAKYLHSNDSSFAIMKTKTMFGTDFWVVVPQSNLKKDQKKFKKLTEGYHDALFAQNVINFLGLNEGDLLV